MRVLSFFGVFVVVKPSVWMVLVVVLSALSLLVFIVLYMVLCV